VIIPYVRFATGGNGSYGVISVNYNPTFADSLLPGYKTRLTF
jgi:hypothetical protein